TAVAFIAHFACHEAAVAAPIMIPAKLQEGGIPRVYVGPVNKKDFPAWLAGMKQAREEERAKIREKLERDPPRFKSVYDSMDLDWILLPHSKILAQDRCLYDPVTRKYTVDKCVDDLEARYGGVGRITFWHHYPNIGIDGRNQFDFFRDLP